MKEKSPIWILVLMISVWLGVSGCVVGPDSNNMDFPYLLESLTLVTQPQPFENASELSTRDVAAAGVESAARFDQRPPLTVSAGTESDVAPGRALVGHTHLPLRDDKRTPVARILWDSLRSMSSVDIWIILSNSISTIGTRVVDEDEQSNAQSAKTTSEAGMSGLSILSTFTTEYLREVSSSPPLIATLQATEVTIDHLESLSWPQILKSPRSFAERELTTGLTGFNSAGAIRRRVIRGVLTAGLVVLGLVMFGRVNSAAPFVPHEPRCALRVSWDYPFEGSKAFPIDGKGTSVTIGSGKFDTIYSPELIAGHIRIGAGRDVLTLTCSGPVRLCNGTVLDPAAETTLVERFRGDRAVFFVAGDSGFVLEQVSRA